MKGFSNASFPPEAIKLMKIALDAAVASLPEPVSTAHVQAIAETILLGQGGRKISVSIAKNGALGTADSSPLNWQTFCFSRVHL
jgi:hypothetical protein